jgi:hypothetical protein
VESRAVWWAERDVLPEELQILPWLQSLLRAGQVPSKVELPMKTALRKLRIAVGLGRALRLGEGLALMDVAGEGRRAGSASASSATRA